MNYNLINSTQQVKNSYVKVEKEILLLKVKIIYNLSKELNVDFEKLLYNEFPGAYIFKEVWACYYN